VGVAIADIAGKGPAAALLAAMLQGMFAVEAATGCGPAMILTRLNQRMLERRLSPRFATLVYAELSPDGRLIYSNAGHNPPILLTHNGVRRLTAGGPILGVFADATYDEETFHLEDRDTLVMFTDGVIEARNAQDRELGEEGLLESLGSGAASPIPFLLSRILTSVREFSGQVEQGDDATVAITRFLQN
jgi:sigma-B regulation protein RsbU (phosphoserine phosphatase)